MTEAAKTLMTAPPPRAAELAPRPAAAGRLGKWLAMLLIAAAVWSALAPVCRSEYAAWDDARALRDNPTLNPVTWHSLRTWWTEPSMDLYMPITWSVWGIISLLTRAPASADHPAFLRPQPFHSANLVVHVLACLVVFQILRLLVGRTWPAAIGALLFGLHPVQVEAVAWTAGMKDVLGGLLALLAVWQYLAAVENRLPGEETGGGAAAWRLGWGWHYAMGTVALVAGMLAKPTASVAVLIVLVLEIMVYRRSWRSVARRLWPWLLAAVACGMEAVVFQPVSDGGANVALPIRPMVALSSITFYVTNLFWPAHLTLDYGQTPMRMTHDPWLVLKCLLAVIILGGIWLMRRSARMVSAGMAVFVVALIPVLGLVSFDFQRYSNVADHYLYLPMLGVALIATIACRRWAGWAMYLAAAVVLASLGVLAHRQSRVWTSAQTLFTQALACNPASWVANESLASYALQRGDNALAARYCRRAIANFPNDANAYVTMGQAMWNAGRKELAFEAYSRALQIDPDNVLALDNLAVAMVELSRLDDAEVLLRRAIAQDPGSANSHLDLGLVFRAQGKIAQAVAEMQTAVALDPYSAHNRAVLAKTMAYKRAYHAVR